MKIVKSFVLAGLFVMGATSAIAQVPAPTASPAATATSAPAPAAATESAKPAAPEALKPTPGIGQPRSGEASFQEQVTANGRYASWFHNDILLPLITVIALFVLVLLLYVVVRFRRAANPVPSKVSHNTLIEVIWTLGPVLILVGVAIPSIDLLAKQFKPAPKDALTVKVTGYQWYWGYTYPDNGGFEVISNMLSEEDALKKGEPAHLGADKRMVVPYGEPIRLQTTGSDVIHSFSVPSLWFKIDAVPGKINERLLFIEKPGVYYGQCSELCGARHGYMPIAVEAVSRPVFNAWLKANGGTVASSKDAKAASSAAAVASGPGASPTTATAAPETPAPAASAKPAA